MQTNGARGDQKGTKASIIQALRTNGPVARIELTHLTGLSRATISQAIAELIQADIVVETESRYSTGGRPATLLELTTHSRLVIGADFSDFTWTLGAFDLSGNVVERQAFAVNSKAPEDVVGSLIVRLQEFLAGLGKKTVKLLGVGMPGLIDIRQGIVSYPDIGWHEVHIAKMIEREIDWPVHLLNRHRARGLTECRFGAGKDFGEIIYIGVGTGVAAGIYNNRQLTTGTNGAAGEIGHTTVLPDGPLCLCGNQGCLQTLISSTAIEQHARLLLRSGQPSAIYSPGKGDLQLIDAETVCLAAEQGDELCVEVIERAAGYIGLAMANLVNTLNPQAIVLGGPIPLLSNLFVDVATRTMQRRAMDSLANGVVVRTATMNDIGGALGAANFALDRSLDYSLFADE